MSKLRVSSFTISLDGYGAGPDQSVENPLGVGGEELHGWMIKTRTFQQMVGEKGGATGVDDEYTAKGMGNVGAWIMGRNMFAPSRGEWPDDGWKGWWGDDPPYHADVFVLTRYPREPVVMKGGTTFHFVTDGIHAALERATTAAGAKEIRVVGGVSVIRQYLEAGLVDELHLAISPIVLGSGEHLLSGIDTLGLGYTCTHHATTPDALHFVLTKG